MCCNDNDNEGPGSRCNTFASRVTKWQQQQRRVSGPRYFFPLFKFFTNNYLGTYDTYGHHHHLNTQRRRQGLSKQPPRYKKGPRDERRLLGHKYYFFTPLTFICRIHCTYHQQHRITERRQTTTTGARDGSWHLVSEGFSFGWRSRFHGLQVQIGNAWSSTIQYAPVPPWRFYSTSLHF
jgi:hypothetical protein